jgi:solute carrier family 25 (mitochondrial phosphate transporter), member 3
MMKFASFETVVEMIYKHAVPMPKSECDKGTQLGISFAGGYIAGVLCAVVSHPADNLVSFLNNAKGATVGDVCLFFCLCVSIYCVYSSPAFTIWGLTILHM